MSAPYAADAGDKLTRALEHVVTYIATHPSWAGPVELELDPDAGEPRVVFDEGWCPRAQASNLIMRRPDAATLAQLDPRTGVRLVITAGYRYGGTTLDVHTLADLVLVDVDTDRPDNTVELSAESDERLILDNAPTFEDSDDTEAFFPADAVIVDVIEDVVAWAVPGATVTIDPALPRATIGTDVTLAAGGSFWQLLNDLADRLDAELYATALAPKAFVLRPRPVTASRSAVILKTGPGGTVTRTRHKVSRRAAGAGDDTPWANVVVLKYADGFSVAKVADGPLGTLNAPRKVLAVERDGMPVTGGSKAAAAIVARAIERGRTDTVSTIAPYWLRPGDTVALTVESEPQRRTLAARVDFGLRRGTAELVLRNPETVTVVDTGE